MYLYLNTLKNKVFVPKYFNMYLTPSHIYTLSAVLTFTMVNISTHMSYTYYLCKVQSNVNS